MQDHSEGDAITEPVHRSRPVLVGVDGSGASLAAVDWAAAEAASRRTSLRVIHAFNWPRYSFGPAGPSAYGPPDADVRAAAGRILDEAVRRAALGSPGLNVDGTVRIGRPSPVMLDEARTAELVVVGSRGLGGFTGLLVGSVSSRLAAHAPCPVVVVMRPAQLCAVPASVLLRAAWSVSTTRAQPRTSSASRSPKPPGSTSGSPPSIAPSRFRPLRRSVRRSG